MTHAESDSNAPPDPKDGQVPDFLPTEGGQIAIAWVVFGSLVACVVGVLAVVAALMP